MARDKYIVNYCDFTNKKDRINDYISQMLNRTNRMFDIQGLPDNIDVRQLERRLQTHGYLVWFKIEDSDIVQMPDSREMKGGVYALWGGLGGVVDFNDDFTFAIVTLFLKSITKALLLTYLTRLLYFDIIYFVNKIKQKEIFL